MNEFVSKIQSKDVEDNRTYLWADIDGVKYGQSYQNTVNTLEDMKNSFTVFYYPFTQVEGQA